MKILYIENHEIFAKTVCNLFLSNDEVNLAPSIALAKSLLKANHFDIVLVDFDLDDGKGDEITTWIKINYPSLKIIATSSHQIGNDKIISAGADSVCAKNNFKNIQTIIDSIV